MTQWGEKNLGSVGRRSFDPADLDAMETDFRTILMCSGAVGKMRVVNGEVVAVRRTGVVLDVSPQWKRKNGASTSRGGTTPARAAQCDRTVDGSKPAGRLTHAVTPPTQPGVLPDCLRQKSLVCIIDGAIAWTKVRELASLESMVRLAHEEDIASDCLATEMRKRGVPMPDTICPGDLSLLSATNLANATMNIVAARDDLVNHLGGYFVPRADDELHEWLVDGKGYSFG